MNKVPYGFQVVDLTGVSVPTSYESRITSAKVRSELEKALASKKNVILVLNGKTYMVSEKDVDVTANVISIDLGLDVTNLGKLVNAVLTVDGDNKTYISQTEISTGGGGGEAMEYVYVMIKCTYDSDNDKWTATLTAEEKAVMDQANTDGKFIVPTLQLVDEDGTTDMTYVTFFGPDYTQPMMYQYPSYNKPYGLYLFRYWYNSSTGTIEVYAYTTPIVDDIVIDVEQKLNKTFDGEQVYRQVFSITGADLKTDWTSMQLIPSGVSKLLKVEGMALTSDGVTILPFYRTNTDALVLTALLRHASGRVEAFCSHVTSGQTTVTTLNVAIEYTKSI